ncbi:MAG: DUF6134 family protein [Defluviicoccus sp.]
MKWTAILIPAATSLMLASAPASAALEKEDCRVSAAAFDPIVRYGEELVFDVWRNGTPVGEHRVTFRRDGDTVRVAAVFALEVRFLGFAAYRYRYVSNSAWRGDCLVSLEALVNDDGKQSRMMAVREGNQMRIAGGRGDVLAPAGIFPTDHWHPGVLGTERVLNTLTGGINRVRIDDRGAVRLPSATGTIAARHYAYTGELSTEVWYDDAGRWVGMRFTGKDGSIVEHRCRSCAANMAAER